MALAVVLGVNPLALLMPQYSGHGIRREITGAGHVKTDVAWHWARFNLESMRAHEVDTPGITSTGLQDAEPIAVPTNAERQRTRASYVGDRVRALEGGRVWVMTANGGHSVVPGDGHAPDCENASAIAWVERLLDLELSDDEAWAATEFDPASPRLRELEGYDADDDEPD